MNSQDKISCEDAIIKKIVQKPKVKEELSHKDANIVPIVEQLDVTENFNKV